MTYQRAIDRALEGVGAGAALPLTLSAEVAPVPAELELRTDEGDALVVLVDGHPVRARGVRLSAGVAGHYQVELELAAARVRLPRLETGDGAKVEG